MTTTWKRVLRDHTKREEAVYGAYVFLLLHGANERDAMKADWLGRQIPGSLVGRAIDTGLIPEARRTYDALCTRRGVPPEVRI